MEENNSIKCQVQSDISRFQHLFDSFVQIYEKPPAEIKCLDNDMIKKTFQIAHAVETLIESYKNSNKVQIWTDLVTTVLIDQDFPLNYDIGFFAKACDKWLEKYFMLKDSFLIHADVAVRIYTSVLSPQRFEAFLLNMMMVSASHHAIQEFIFESEIDTKTLQLKLILRDWISEYEKDRSPELIEIIQSMMSPYNSKKSLHILIGIIAIETDSINEGHVRTLVEKEVLKTMCFRNKLSTDFWYKLFEVDSSIMMKACELSQSFHESVCKFIIFIGSMMDMVEVEGKTEWVPMSTSHYPELNYKFLVRVLRQLINKKFSSRDATIQMLLKAEEETECALWKKVFEML